MNKMISVAMFGITLLGSSLSFADGANPTTAAPDPKTGGTVKGAAVGGLGGAAVGHPVAGAVTGAVIGHHMRHKAKKEAEKQQKDQADAAKNGGTS